MTYARQLIAVLVFAVMAWGCAGGQTGSEGSIDSSSAICAPPPVDGCNVDTDCEQRASSITARLQAPATGAPRRLVGATCGRDLACDSGVTCWCQIERDDSGPSEIWLGGNGCALYGRWRGCLWPAEELATCRPGSCDCANACMRATALLDADDARVPAVQTRVARCVDHACRYAFSIDDRCYAGGPELSQLVDCARTDDELLEAASEHVYETPACHDLILCSTDSAERTPDPDIASCVQEQQSGVTAP